MVGGVLAFAALFIITFIAFRRRTKPARTHGLDYGSSVQLVNLRPSSFPTDESQATATAIMTTLDREADAEEWNRVAEKVKLGTQGHIKAYVEERIKNGQRPLIFRVVGVRRVDNQVLKRRYEMARAYLRSQGAAEIDDQYCFHGMASFNGCPDFICIEPGTRAGIIQAICDKGLLRVGHALNPSKATDEGWFGDPHYGVNVTPYVDYCLKVHSFAVNVRISSILRSTQTIWNHCEIPRRSTSSCSKFFPVGPTTSNRCSLE